MENLSKFDVHISRRSSLYITPPWGVETQDDFINVVCEVKFDQTPEKLLEIVLEVEQMMGRYRWYKWGPRLIDIDILEFNREVRDTESLKIPHPYYTERSFVLVPMADLEPEWVPTGDHRPISSILAEMSLEGVESFTDEQYQPIV